MKIYKFMAVTLFVMALMSAWSGNIVLGVAWLCASNLCCTVIKVLVILHRREQQLQAIIQAARGLQALQTDGSKTT